jgi:hypothetical protein
MNEIEKLDLIIERLVSTRNRLGHPDLIKDLGLKISEEEARYLCNVLISDRVVDSINTSISELVIIKYTHSTQLFYEQGGYAKRNEIKKQIQDENLRNKRIQDEKLRSEAKLAKWQVKTFWWIFLLALIGGICGIVSLVMQLT